MTKTGQLEPAETILLEQAYATSEKLLRSWKTKTLRPKQVETMKLLEGTVQSLEVLLLRR